MEVKLFEVSSPLGNPYAGRDADGGFFMPPSFPFTFPQDILLIHGRVNVLPTEEFDPTVVIFDLEQVELKPRPRVIKAPTEANEIALIVQVLCEFRRPGFYQAVLFPRPGSRDIAEAWLKIVGP